jgi:bifunctional non-homologous end joining protein LigD
MRDTVPDVLAELSRDERALVRARTRSEWRPPMLATLTKETFSDERWLFERKLDGVRALTVCTKGRPSLWSRNHKDMTKSYPELAPVLADQPVSEFVADGEIVAFSGRQTSFARLQARFQLTDPGKIARTGVDVFYYLFDLLVLDGLDLTRLPLRRRKRLLRKAFEFGGPLRYSAHRNADGEAYHREACARGWEGLIAKRADSPYQEGRSRDWLKFKCVRDQELVVGGFTDPAGSRQGFGALLVGYYDRSRLRYAGKAGTGYNDVLLRDLRARMDRLATDSSPFAESVRETGTHWIRPELVAEIGFTEWTSDGKLRHPRFLGLRTDKDPRDVVREQ